MAQVSVVQHIGRYGEILQVLFKYGFWDICRLAKLQGLLELSHLSLLEKAKQTADLPAAQRLRMALEELGPTFVKVGQILSSRRDLINDEFYFELRRLQKNVGAFPYEDVRKEVEQALGQDMEDVFSSFDETPIAAASIGQVHRATLKRERRRVAVKVRRPGIQQKIVADIEIMRHLAAFMEKHAPAVAAFDPVGLVEEIAKGLWREIHFEWEARQQEEFARLFEDCPTLHVPAVYEQYTADNLLVAEYVTGIPCDDPVLLQRADIKPDELAEEMTRLVFRMIFELGYFHADPHPGNMAVRKPGVVILYDYGMVGRFSEPFRRNLAMAIHGLVQSDVPRLTEALLGMSADGHVKDTGRLQEDLSLFASEHLDRPLEDIHLEDTTNRLLALLREHELKMRPEFYWGVKALTQIEAVARTLHPEVNYIRLGKPYAQAVLEREFSPASFGKTLYWTVLESVSMLRDLPLELRNFLGRLKHGDINLPVRHTIDPDGFEPLRTTMNHIANRLATALMAAALLMTGGLLHLAGTGPHWAEFPVIAVVALGLGFFLTLRLIWSIWKHGGM